MILPTTTVGSLPKPDYLTKARFQFSKGQISKQELESLEKKATKEWIEFQEEIGIDILVDGEMYRGDMVTYFAEHFKGFEISGLVRSYGNRYYRKPVAVGEIERLNPVTVEWFQFAQNLTQKPVKGMLTGPYTIMDWSFDEFYPSRRDFCLRLAEVVHEEAKDLQEAGAQYIQIDEPAVSVRPEELELAIEAMGIVTQGLKAYTLTHICYGDFPKIYPKMLEIPVNQIDLELSNNEFDLLDLFKRAPFTSDIGLGVLDVHSHRTETKDEVKARIQKALKVIPKEKIYVSPDCGLKTREVEEAKAKLRVMVEATKEIRETLQ
ncbi:MAG: methionine synthase [Omnitrophica bacterium RIFCSPHIGHO2_02_FULL_46_11]|nr:MAG: methionine synthase [Omnitrophica bacterium RIFCSPLOWO2_01_FULL_45_10b]OGW87941.1 MAG: methionine synthase [Omnitrophica bacterium RIFCSPHIGHO2_02_FULL_46_11]